VEVRTTEYPTPTQGFISCMHDSTSMLFGLVGVCGRTRARTRPLPLERFSLMRTLRPCWTASLVSGEAGKRVCDEDNGAEPRTSAEEYAATRGQVPSGSGNFPRRCETRSERLLTTRRPTEGMSAVIPTHGGGDLPISPNRPRTEPKICPGQLSSHRASHGKLARRHAAQISSGSTPLAFVFDETDQTHLNDQDLDEELRVGGVGKGSGRAGDADGDTAEEVAQPDGETGPEQREA
jgi:hypothetical protein